jgi:hypothetical protein
MSRNRMQKHYYNVYKWSWKDEPYSQVNMHIFYGVRGLQRLLDCACELYHMARAMEQLYGASLR